MKKVFYSILLVLFSINTVLAQDLTYDTEGINSIGENQIYFLADRFNLKTAYEENTYSLPESFKIISEKTYTQEEYENGTYDRDRTNLSNLTYGSSQKSQAYTLVYTPTLTKREHIVTGTIVFNMKRAAILQDDTLCDIKYTISNIKIRPSINTTRPVSLMRNNMTHISYLAQQEFAYSEFVDGASPNQSVGVSFEVNIEISNSETGEPVNANYGIMFKDLDQPDSIVIPEGGVPEGEENYLDEDGNPRPYVERITLIEGVAENIHVEEDNILNITDTEYGTNTSYHGLGRTLDDQNDLTAFSTLLNGKKASYRWYGSGCGTVMYTLPVTTTQTETFGSYPDNVTITPSDDKVQWKENKEITITPDKGYHIDKIVIDDVTINYAEEELKDGQKSFTIDDKTYTFTEVNGVVKYTFTSVLENHSIKVSVEKNPVEPEETPTEEPTIVEPKNPKTNRFSVVGIFILTMLTSTTVFILFYNQEKIIRKEN